jgi:argininosuccinate synthase
MSPVLVLAYDGESDARAIDALRRRWSAPVVTMTVDIGQSRDVRAVREVALSAGAVRAHVFDCVDEFVRTCVLPAVQRQRTPLHTAKTAMAYPIIAARLVEVARREQTHRVAHGGGQALTASIRELDPSLDVVALDSASWRPPAAIVSRHLLQRPVADPSIARGVPAQVAIAFDGAVPVAINGVPLTLAELIESLSLLGGQHGIGHAEATDAPGALVLAAAYRALAHQSGVVRLELLDGRQRVLSTDSPDPSGSASGMSDSALVTHA